MTLPTLEALEQIPTLGPAEIHLVWDGRPERALCGADLTHSVAVPSAEAADAICPRCLAIERTLGARRIA